MQNEINELLKNTNKIVIIIEELNITGNQEYVLSEKQQDEVSKVLKTLEDLILGIKINLGNSDEKLLIILNRLHSNIRNIKFNLNNYFQYIQKYINNVRVDIETLKEYK